MLLRLLPCPSPSNPSPATILFTLPMTPSPYSGKGLPLPPNLLAHRTFCMQEGIECSNVLLGDKASWIGGVVDEVTFSLQAFQITAQLIDGSSIALPISADCESMLHAVIEQVQLSFAPNPLAVAPVAGPSLTHKRSRPSTLLYSLLSPLLTIPSSATPATPPPNMARIHRRQARSVLVDAFRGHVLPALKEVLPASYLLWTIAGEAEIKQLEWEQTKEHVNSVLREVGITVAPRPVVSQRDSLARSDSYGDSLSSLTSSSEDDDDTPPTTPGTSITSCSNSTPPLAHLSSLPATSMIPATHRSTYAALVGRLAALASRLSVLKKIRVHMEREESRRKWSETMEASKTAEKALRKAWSAKTNAQSLWSSHSVMMARPIKSSPLWRSTTPESESNTWTHPAMQDSVSVSDEEVEDSSASSESEDEKMDGDLFATGIVVRPISPLLNSSRLYSNNYSDLPEAPALVSSNSQESISSLDSEMDSDCGSAPTSPTFETTFINVQAPKLLRPIPKIWGSDSDDMDEDVEEEAFASLELKDKTPVQRPAWGRGRQNVRVLA